MGNKVQRFTADRVRSDILSIRRAVTIIELMIALALSGIVVSMVFFSWNYIMRHTTIHQRKALFQAEADRIAQSIMGAIKKSPEIIAVKSNGIVFLSSNGLDTIVYECVNGDFRKNDTTVPCNAQDARITRFTVETGIVDKGTNSTNSIVLSLSICLEDRFGNTSTIPLTVRAAVPPSRLEDIKGKWNF